MMGIQQQPRSTYTTAAAATSIARAHWQRSFRRIDPPVTRLRRGALPTSFLVASTRFQASNSRNTTSLFPRTGINSSALTQGRDRTSQKVHTRRSEERRVGKEDNA